MIIYITNDFLALFVYYSDFQNGKNIHLIVTFTFNDHIYLGNKCHRTSIGFVLIYWRRYIIHAVQAIININFAVRVCSHKAYRKRQMMMRAAIHMMPPWRGRWSYVTQKNGRACARKNWPPMPPPTQRLIIISSLWESNAVHLQWTSCKIAIVNRNVYCYNLISHCKTHATPIHCYNYYFYHHAGHYSCMCCWSYWSLYSCHCATSW